MPARTYLEHYVAGEHEQVWAELQALGAAVREEPLYAEAQAVARETMRRVRHNIEVLIPRLAGLGYEFGYRWAGGRNFPSGLTWPLFTPPAPNITTTIAELERRVGTLPLSLRAFYEVVGSVNFVGKPPDAWTGWRTMPDDSDARYVYDGLDELYVYPAEVALQDAMTWQEHYGDVTEEEWDMPGRDEDDICDGRAYYALPRDCWLVPVAPDEWLKYDFSGCGAYEIATPALTADARLLTEHHRTTFVNYLRICFRWAGFPKLERIPGTAGRAPALSVLTRDLLPI